MDALYDEAWRSLDNISIAAGKVKEKALHQIITFSLLAIFGGIWISIYMSRKITTPIRALSLAASSVAKGAPYPEVEKTTEDELGELVASFNQMALDLKTSRHQIEIYKREYRRIRERAVEDGNVSSYDTRLMKKNGDIVRISLTVSRLKDRRGTVIGLVVIGKDITKK